MKNGTTTDTEEQDNCKVILNSSKLENLKEMDHFLKTYHLKKVKSRPDKQFKQTYNL